MRSNKLSTGIVTAAFIGMVVASAATDVSAQSSMSPVSSTSKQLIEGKSLASSKRCTGCHGAALTGNAGFSPSLHESGVLAEYNKKTFETVLNTGVTNDGGHVQQPMPVYHLPAPQADALYAYLKSLK